MGIKAKFNVNEVVRQATTQAVEDVHRVMFNNLSFVGEEAVKIARERGSYTDQTGNLRASTGYAVAYNGSVIGDNGFDPNAATSTKKTRDGGTGAKEGKDLAVEIASQHKKGYVLVVVAGMNYGKWVEKRNYDVLTFTEANARILANELMSKAFGTAWAG